MNNINYSFTLFNKKQSNIKKVHIYQPKIVINNSKNRLNNVSKQNIYQRVNNQRVNNQKVNNQKVIEQKVIEQEMIEQ